MSLTCKHHSWISLSFKCGILWGPTLYFKVSLVRTFPWECSWRPEVLGQGPGHLWATKEEGKTHFWSHCGAGSSWGRWPPWKQGLVSGNTYSSLNHALAMKSEVLYIICMISDHFILVHFENNLLFFRISLRHIKEYKNYYFFYENNIHVKYWERYLHSTFLATTNCATYLTRVSIHSAA